MPPSCTSRNCCRRCRRCPGRERARARATSSCAASASSSSTRARPIRRSASWSTRSTSAAIGMIATLFDVEQVEVLRGPQGTRYGANALGGLIKVKTREPRSRATRSTPKPVGDDGLWSAGAAAGGAWPLPATVAAPGARCCIARSSDGFRDNRYLGRDDTNGRDETTARAAGSGSPPEARWRADLGLLHADFDNGYDAFAIDNSFDTLSDRPGRDAQRSDGASLDLAWRLAATRSSCARSRPGPIRTSSRVSTATGATTVDWGDAGPYDFFSRHAARPPHAQPGPAPLAVDRRRAGPGSPAPGARGSRRTITSRTTAATSTDAFVRELDSRYRATSAALYGQARLASARRDTTLDRGPARRAARRPLRRQRRRRLRSARPDVGRRAGGHAAAAAMRRALWASLARGFRAGGFNIGTSVPAEPPAIRRRSTCGPPRPGWKGGRAAGSRCGRRQLLLHAPRAPAGRDLAAARSGGSADIHVPDRQCRERRGLGARVVRRIMRLGDRLDSRRCCPGWSRAFTATASATATSRAGSSHTRRNGKRRSPRPGGIPAGWMARLDLSGEAGFYFDTSHDQRADSRFLANLRAGYEAERWSVARLGAQPVRRALSGARILFRERAAGFPDPALPALGRSAPGRASPRAIPF